MAGKWACLLSASAYAVVVVVVVVLSYNNNVDDAIQSPESSLVARSPVLFRQADAAGGQARMCCRMLANH